MKTTDMKYMVCERRNNSCMRNRLPSFRAALNYIFKEPELKSAQYIKRYDASETTNYEEIIWDRGNPIVAQLSNHKDPLKLT
jgi:hypothetical protein